MIEFFRQIMIFSRNLGLILTNKPSLSKVNISKLMKGYLYMKFVSMIPSLIVRKINKINFLGRDLYFFDLKTTLSLVESIFVENEYFFNSKNRQPKILDLGGNIGLSTIYFKMLYPDCQITSYEADPTTHLTLRKNVDSFELKRVVTKNLAITSKKGFVSFYIDKSGPGSPLMSTNPLRIQNKKGIKVASTKLSEIIKSKIDFLKIDIEGSELEVLKDLDKSKKINKIEQMIIEYHHHINPDVDLLSDFLRILEKNGFGYQIHAAQNSPFRSRVFEDIQIFAYRKK